jgi:predicted amidophosphoribosyltransferase
MEPHLWTLLAVFVPYFLGLIIYLIARHPLQAACPSCGTRVPEKASFCPSCGKPLARSCSRCQISLQNGSRFCHACGQEVAGG